MRLLLSSILFLCAVSCINSDNSVVDQQYIQSSHYQQFSKQVSTEIRTKQAREATLQAHLQQMNSCDPNRRFTYPFTFNKEIVTKILQGNDVNCYKEIAVENMKLKLVVLGSSTFGDVHFRWILLDGETVYTNQELMVGIYVNQDLRDFRRIGVLKENISEKNISDVNVQRIDQHILVSTQTKRHILYPIEQQYNDSQRFEITKQGSIKNGG